MRRLILIAMAVAHPLTASAQTTAVKRAAGTITEAEIRARIEMIAHDSMGGRDTPSPGLEKTAEWMAREFKRLGLKSGGDNGGYLQRFPIHVSTVDPDSAFVLFSGPNGEKIHLGIVPDLVVQGSIGNQLAEAGVVLVGGPIDPTQLGTFDLKGQVVIWIADWSTGIASGVQAAVAALMSREPRAVMAVINSDSVFAAIGGGGSTGGPEVEYGAPVPPGPATAAPFLALVAESRLLRDAAEVGPTFAQLRASAAMAVVPVADWRATMIHKRATPVPMTLPNTVAILEGSDPTLRNQYLVFSAHMDHVGSRCGGATPADQICNGADDDASGTVGVVELAEAFAEPGARPKRSLIFLGVSGEERGLWGSEYFGANPPVDIKAIVANLNMDMIGRNWKDTIVAIGKVHSDLGATADRVAAAHPDLGMTVVDDLWPQENLYFRSDHYNFAKRGVPILFFTSGLHGDYHAVTDSPEKIDAEKEARVLRLVFHIGQEIGNRPERPKWKPESYRRIVEAVPE